MVDDLEPTRAAAQLLPLIRTSIYPDGSFSILERHEGACGRLLVAPTYTIGLSKDTILAPFLVRA